MPIPAYRIQFIFVSVVAAATFFVTIILYVFVIVPSAEVTLTTTTFSPSFKFLFPEISTLASVWLADAKISTLFTFASRIVILYSVTSDENFGFNV